MSGSDPRFGCAPDVLCRSVGPDVVLAPPGREDFELLSGPAGTIWRFLEEPMTQADLVDSLSELYGATRDMIASDVRPLLEDLLERGLIREVVEADA